MANEPIIWRPGWEFANVAPDPGMSIHDRLHYEAAYAKSEFRRLRAEGHPTEEVVNWKRQAEEMDKAQDLDLPDDIEELAEKMQQAHPDAEVHVAPASLTDDPVGFRVRAQGQQGNFVEFNEQSGSDYTVESNRVSEDASGWYYTDRAEAMAKAVSETERLAQYEHEGAGRAIDPIPGAASTSSGELAPRPGPEERASELEGAQQ